jgi:hypothetical protein
MSDSPRPGRRWRSSRHQTRKPHSHTVSHISLTKRAECGQRAGRDPYPPLDLATGYFRYSTSPSGSTERLVRAERVRQRSPTWSRSRFERGGELAVKGLGDVLNRPPVAQQHRLLDRRLAHDLQLVAMEPGRADRSPMAGESPRRGRRAHGRPGTLLRERGTRRRGGGPRGSPFDIRPADLLPRPQQLDQGPAPGICSSNAAMVTYLLSDLAVGMTGQLVRVPWRQAADRAPTGGQGAGAAARPVGG